MNPVASRRRTRRRLPRYSELAALIRPRRLPLRPVERRLAKAATVGDLRSVARRVVPRAVFDYVDGAAGAEISLLRTRDAIGRVEFLPRVLKDVSSIDLTAELLGVPSALPLVFAPTGFTRLMHTEGEVAVARVAQRAGIPYGLSTMGTTSLEVLAAAAPDAHRWFQLYLWRDRQLNEAMVERARVAGYEALVLTVDTPVGGARLRDVRNGFSIPPALTFRTVANAARHPRWWIDMLTTEPLEFASLRSWGGTLGELADRVFEPAATIADVARLRTDWPGKLVVKGVTGVDDARALVDAGVDAIVVSNHGGRQLDRSATPLEALPGVVAAVGGKAEVYLDGGILEGADIVAALAFGARGCLVGRAYLYGLMAGGERGVQRALDILTAEITRTMQLLGVTSLAELTADRVRLRP